MGLMQTVGPQPYLCWYGIDPRSNRSWTILRNVLAEMTTRFVTTLDDCWSSLLKPAAFCPRHFASKVSNFLSRILRSTVVSQRSLGLRTMGRPLLSSDFELCKGLKASRLAEYVIYYVVLSFFSLPRAALQMLCREVLVWKQLRHPFILPFLGVDSETFQPKGKGFARMSWALCKTQRHMCLVSPWMEHGTVLDYMKSLNGQDLTADRLVSCHLRNYVAG